MRKIDAYLCLSGLILLCVLQACDATIHEYPSPETSLVVVQPAVDRRQPPYYKEVAYDAEWNRTETLLEAEESQPYGVADDAAMRIIVEVFEGQATGADYRPLARRVLNVDAYALPPQDTVHFYLPHGEYSILAWADYVNEDNPVDWHYRTDTLTAIRTDIGTYPHNPHHRSTAAGQAAFNVDFQLTPEGYPTLYGGNGRRIEDEIQYSRTVPVDLLRPAGRYRVVALDYQDFLQTGGSADGLTVKVVYRQYVSVGFNMATSEPNLFISTYSFNLQPDDIDYEGKRDESLFGDYIFAASSNETNVLADFYFYDAQGQEINHCEGIEIPLMRNRETIVKGYFLTREIGNGNAIGIDENFEGEYVIEVK